MLISARGFDLYDYSAISSMVLFHVESKIELV